MKKRTLLLAVCWLAFGVLVAEGKDPFVVGIEQSTRDAWEAVASEFEGQAGIQVQLRSFAQTNIAYQVLMQTYGWGQRLDFAMIPESWGVSLSRYLVDLTDVESQLVSRGVDLVDVSGRPLGVTIPFAPDWFLGVLEWPDDREPAVEFLIAVAGGTTGAQPDFGVTPSISVASLKTEKIPLADHNPRIDGALGVLLAAAETAIGTIATEVFAALPASASSAIAGLADMFGIPFSTATSTVTVVLESLPGQSSTANVRALSSLGISPTKIAATDSLVKVSVSLTQLGTLARQLGGVAYIRAPYVPFALGTPTQGTAAIGADAYHALGIRGSGVKVAVIDLGFSGLRQAQARGDLPLSVGEYDLTGSGLTSGIPHGTAVAEIIHDVAPDAQLYLIKIADEVDLDQAVEYCDSQGIDIINHSLGWYNTNFYDGTGTIADIARRAVNTHGILWVNAAGNEAESHWEGTFADGDYDGWHDASLTLHASSGSEILLYLTWNEWPQATTDYDLYLYDPYGTLVASSTKHQTGMEEPTESIHMTASQSGTYSMRIRGTGARSLELYSLYQGLSPTIASSSILAPANASEVVAVGAIGYTRYTTGPQQPYSSQGPTNDGRTKPDLCAPDNVSTGTVPYTTFPGTSAAAPHATGAAALLLSQEPTMSQFTLRSRLLGNTVAMGNPNAYGHGRLYLQPPTQPNQAPTASFTTSPPTPQVGVAVTFDGASSADPDGTIISYSWDFGDGTGGAGISTTHTYLSAGVYTTRLTVTDDDGSSDQATRSVVVSAVSNQSPTAAFTAAPSPTQPGTWVSFDASASFDPDGTITSYAWSFGDGSSGSGLSAYHSYSSPGTYVVQLVVTDDDGATDFEAKQIVVQAASAPDLTVASLTYSPSSPSVGQSVTFSVSVSNAGTASAGFFRIRLAGTSASTVTYLSGLGAGSSRTVALTLALSASAETFTATVDDLGQVAEANETNNSRSVTVTASTVPPPMANAGGPYTGTAGTPVAFNGSGSTGTIATYAWTFGDGTTGQGVSPSHTYAAPGTYLVTLTVSGPGGQSNASTQATVAAAAPAMTAQLYLPKTTYEVDEAITITYTTNRSAYVYLCEVTPDNRVILLFPNAFESSNYVGSGTHTFPGSWYTVRLSEPIGTESLYLFAATSRRPQFPTSFGLGFTLLSTNPTSFRNSVLTTMQTQLPSGDWAFDTLTFDIVPSAPPPNQPPVARFNVSTSSPQIGTPVTFNASSSYDLDGSVVSYAWDFNDGTTASGTVVSHAFGATGTYTVRLTVTDDDGATDVDTGVLVVVGVPNQSPSAAFTFSPQDPVVGEAVAFDAGGSSDLDGSISAYAWNFDDGGTGSGLTAAHTFTASGTYDVRLTVTDNNGATGTTTKSVSVTPSDEIGWVSPVSHEDPAREWFLEEQAYDNNTKKTFAYYHLPGEEWSSWIILHAPEGGLLCDRVRFFVSSNISVVHIHIWDIDVYRDGEWIDVYDDIPAERDWTEVAFGTGTVTKIRLRAYNTWGGQWRACLWDLDFHDATAPPP